MVTFEVDMQINSLSKTKAKEIRKLVSKKERDNQSLFLAEGEKCVMDMIGAFIPHIIIVSKDWAERNSELVSKFQDIVFIGDKRDFEIISSLNSIPDIIAVFKKTREEDKDLWDLNKNSLYLLLDEIQDPGNLGTIIRTCDWFGVYDIFASKNTVDVWSPKVVQSTMGSLARVRVHYLDLKNLVLTNRSLKLYGTVLNGEPIENFNHVNSGFLLMGNEGRGISEDMKELIDIPLTIPPVNSKYHPDSLNVAIATAIILSRLSS